MVKLLPYIIFIDSCAFWPPQQEEKIAAGRLFDLEEEGHITLEIGKATEEEMKKVPNKKLMGRVVSRMVSMTMPTATQDIITYAEIKELLFPGKEILTGGEENDVSNLFHAQDSGASMFVTVDKRHILSKAHLIKQRFAMSVVSPTQCLNIVLDRMKGIKNITVREFE